MRRLFPVLLGVWLIPLWMPAGDIEAPIPKAWTPNGGSWSYMDPGSGEAVLELTASAPVPREPVRHPANRLWLTSEVSAPFTLDFRTRSLVADRKGADICVILETRDPVQWFYLHVSNDSNGKNHQVIMEVDFDTGSRRTIQRPERPPAVALKDWTRLQVTLDRKGVLTLRVGGKNEVNMSAFLPCLDIHRIGIGSFNDPAQFSGIKL